MPTDTIHTPHRLMTIAEGASYVDLSPRYLKRLVAERRLPYVKIGRLVRLRPQDLDALVHDCMVSRSVD